MLEDDTLVHARLKTPKAAALAGIAFSLLMFTIFGLLRRSIPADPLDSGAWLATDTATIALALNLIPFAGVAFLWFIGVLRDRLGRQEDRFFATVFFGSALLYLAMLFTAAALIGAVMLLASTAEPNQLMNSASVLCLCLSFQIRRQIDRRTSRCECRNWSESVCIAHGSEKTFAFPRETGRFYGS